MSPHLNGVSTAFNRDKRSAHIDYRNPRGLAVFHPLLSTADVFVESAIPGSLHKYGRDFPALTNSAGAAARLLLHQRIRTGRRVGPTVSHWTQPPASSRLMNFWTPSGPARRCARVAPLGGTYRICCGHEHLRGPGRHGPFGCRYPHRHQLLGSSADVRSISRFPGPQRRSRRIRLEPPATRDPCP
jgi:hypothetical protein